MLKTIILIAPNVTEQMGGEGMKALHIFQELSKSSIEVLQITHSRNRSELEGRLHLKNIIYVEDSVMSLCIWHSVIFRLFLNWWFSAAAVKLAEDLVLKKGLARSEALIWQTEPNSPVQQRALAKRHINCFGPINGNIYLPPIFSHKETILKTIRRKFHRPLQVVNKILFSNFAKAEIIFCAGGDRTRESLKWRGCDDSIIVDSLDCGIQDSLADRSRITHVGNNYRFVHYRAGTLHKGTFLAIQSLKKTKLPVVLDIIGRGPDIEVCRRLAKELDVEKRVNFLGWFDSHEDLIKSLSKYRGYILPTLEDANGIAVQEAMALGLPPICLDWGGPQLLIDHQTDGYLVRPESIESITTDIALYLDSLAGDGDLAEEMSVRCKEKAERWRWNAVIQGWLEHFKLRFEYESTGIEEVS